MERLTLDAFKELVKEDENLRRNLSGLSDTVDFDNGTATIHKENINRYLEKYSCKDEIDLTDTLWYNYGMFVRII